MKTTPALGQGLWLDGIDRSPLDPGRVHGLPQASESS
jgi:hypothetical protein